jgi:hypothetical protein
MLIFCVIVMVGIILIIAATMGVYASRFAMQKVMIDLATEDGVWYLEDYIPLYDADPLQISPETIKVIIDLGKFVLHLFHEKIEYVLVKVDQYRIMRIVDKEVKRLETPIVSNIEVQFIGSLDVVHHGNINDPIVRAVLELKHSDKPIKQEGIKTRTITIKDSDIDPIEVMEESFVRDNYLKAEMAQRKLNHAGKFFKQEMRNMKTFKKSSKWERQNRKQIRKFVKGWDA